MNEAIPASAESVHPKEHCPSFRLAPSRWRGWRRELPRGGFALYFITLIGHSLLMCDCGAVPSVIMAASAFLPLVFGSRLQRIAAGVCLAFAVFLAYTGFLRTVTMRERIEGTRQLQQQKNDG